MNESPQPMYSPIELAMSELNQLFLSKDYPQKVVERVSTVLMEAVAPKLAEQPGGKGCFTVILTSKAIEEAADKLIEGGEHSNRTYLQRDLLNDYIFYLSVKSFTSEDRSFQYLKAPYYDLPQQIKRELLITSDRGLAKYFEAVRVIRDRLLKLRIPTEWIKHDGLCSFAASAMLFGKMLMPNLERLLAEMTPEDISLDPASFRIPLDRGVTLPDRAFFRYFLPAPASNYLARHRIIRQKAFSKDKESPAVGSGGAKQCKSFLGVPSTFDQSFRQWTVVVLQEAQFANPMEIPLDTFRRVVLTMSVLNDSKQEEILPFILAVLSGRLVSYSVAAECLFSCPKPQAASPKSRKKKQSELKSEKEAVHLPATSAIRSILNDLRTKRREKGRKILPTERKASILKIREIEARHLDDLPSAARRNVELYASWLITLFVSRETVAKTMKNYAEDAEILLDNLPNDKPIDQLSCDYLRQTIVAIRKRRSSPAILNGIKSFCAYIASEVHDWKNPALNLGRLEEQWLTTKPLIYPEQVDAILQLIDADLQASRAQLTKKDKRQRRDLPAIEKRCAIYRHLIQLAFYLGIRISEFALLRLENVIYDDGCVICIRETKTPNGVRNLPLSLVPPHYRQEFAAYLASRREECKMLDRPYKEYLFPSPSKKVRKASSLGKVKQHPTKSPAYNTGTLTDMISSLFIRAGFPGVDTHHLRHAFSNWLLLNWFFFQYPEYRNVDDYPFLSHTFFSTEPLDTEPLDRLKSIFPAECRTDKYAMTHILPIIARLMGHGGPAMTIKRYIHVIDWLFSIISKKWNKKSIPITSKQGQAFLDVAYKTLPMKLKGGKKKLISYGDLLDMQIKQL